MSKRLQISERLNFEASKIDGVSVIKLNGLIVPDKDCSKFINMSTGVIDQIAALDYYNNQMLYDRRRAVVITLSEDPVHPWMRAMKQCKLRPVIASMFIDPHLQPI